MTTFSRKSTIWSYKRLKNVHEPFDEKLLKNCTPDEIQAKLAFLENNVSLIRTECEALEMYLIKLHPEFLMTRVIDVSWMPYDLKTKKPKLVTIVPRVMKTLRKHSTMAKSIMSNSMFSVVQRSLVVKKITLSHMIIIIGRQIINLTADFEKYFIDIIKKCRRIDNEIENFETEYQRVSRHIEMFKLEILEGAFNKITKSIPASKYKLFIKKRLTKNTITITEINIKLSSLRYERKTLIAKREDLKILINKATKTDVWQSKLMYKKLMRQSYEQAHIIRSVLADKKKIYQDYCAKKHKLEKYRSKLDLPSMDKKIKSLKYNLKKQKPSLKIPKNGDDKPHRNDTDNVMISDEMIDHYIEVLNYIKQSDAEIKILEKEIHRQNLTIQLCKNNLKKYLNLKEIDFNLYQSISDHSMENDQSQD